MNPKLEKIVMLGAVAISLIVLIIAIIVYFKDDDNASPTNDQDNFTLLSPKPSESIKTAIKSHRKEKKYKKNKKSFSNFLKNHNNKIMSSAKNIKEKFTPIKKKSVKKIKEKFSASKPLCAKMKAYERCGPECQCKKTKFGFQAKDYVLGPDYPVLPKDPEEDKVVTESWFLSAPPEGVLNATRENDCGELFRLDKSCPQAEVACGLCGEELYNGVM